jgi:hypothetical protein
MPLWVGEERDHDLEVNDGVGHCLSSFLFGLDSPLPTCRARG